MASNLTRSNSECEHESTSENGLENTVDETICYEPFVFIIEE
jgi:hypothetical protein